MDLFFRLWWFPSTGAVVILVHSFFTGGGLPPGRAIQLGVEDWVAIALLVVQFTLWRRRGALRCQLDADVPRVAEQDEKGDLGRAMRSELNGPRT